MHADLFDSMILSPLQLEWVAWRNGDLYSVVEPLGLPLIGTLAVPVVPAVPVDDCVLLNQRAASHAPEAISGFLPCVSPWQ